MLVFVFATTIVHSHLSSLHVQSICILKKYNLKTEMQSINPGLGFSGIMLLFPAALADKFFSV